MHPSHVDFVARILVSYRTLSNILVALSRRCSPRTRRGDAFLGAERRTSRLRSVTPRFTAKRFLLLKHCTALVTQRCVAERASNARITPALQLKNYKRCCIR